MDWSSGGELLGATYRTPAHEVDYKAAGLSPPPMGLRWYHVDKAYVLANRTTGLIVKTMPDTAAATP
jgi:Ni/Co efflux regulator RcnB